MLLLDLENMRVLIAINKLLKSTFFHSSVQVSQTFQKSLSKERQSNRKILFTIIRSIRFLARQGLALRGHNSYTGNFMQLLKLLSETELAVQSWLAKECENTHLEKFKIKFYIRWPIAFSLKYLNLCMITLTMHLQQMK